MDIKFSGPIPSLVDKVARLVDKIQSFVDKIGTLMDKIKDFVDITNLLTVS